MICEVERRRYAFCFTDCPLGRSSVGERIYLISDSASAVAEYVAAERKYLTILEAYLQCVSMHSSLP